MNQPHIVTPEEAEKQTPSRTGRTMPEQTDAEHGAQVRARLAANAAERASCAWVWGMGAYDTLAYCAAYDLTRLLARAERAERERDEALAKVERLAGKVARVKALHSSGEREWHNSGRSGWTEVVDLPDLLSALADRP